jgi:hypothetical protein
MSDNLIESVAPHLSAPVTREPVKRESAEADGGTELSNGFAPPLILFADDDAE